MISKHNSPPVIIASILRPEGTTGVHTHVRELSSYLSQQSIRHELVTPWSSSPALSCPLFALRLPLSYLTPPLAVAWYRHWHTVFLERALRARLRRAGRAVVYAQGPEAALAAVRARTDEHQRVIMAVHFLGSQAALWTARGHLTPGGPVARSILATENRHLDLLDAIVYVSQAAKDQFIASHPEAASIPSQVVPNFVSPVQPRAQPPLGDLVSLGRLEAEKRHSYLLEVLAAAKGLGYSYSLDIYGTGPLRKALQKLADKLGVSEQVRLRGFNASVRHLLPSYRAYVHGSTVEAGPIAIIEAMAAGIPVFAPNSGGVSDLLTSGTEGFYWPTDDPVTAASCLISQLQDEPLLERVGRAGRDKFARCYSTSVVAPKLVALLYAGTPGQLPSAAAQNTAKDLVPTTMAHDRRPAASCRPPRNGADLPDQPARYANR